MQLKCWVGLVSEPVWGQSIFSLHGLSKLSPYHRIYLNDSVCFSCPAIFPLSQMFLCPVHHQRRKETLCVSRVAGDFDKWKYLIPCKCGQKCVQHKSNTDFYLLIKIVLLVHKRREDIFVFRNWHWMFSLGHWAMWAAGRDFTWFIAFTFTGIIYWTTVLHCHPTPLCPSIWWRKFSSCEQHTEHEFNC